MHLQISANARRYCRYDNLGTVGPRQSAWICTSVARRKAVAYGGFVWCMAERKCNAMQMVGPRIDSRFDSDMATHCTTRFFFSTGAHNGNAAPESGTTGPSTNRSSTLSLTPSPTEQPAACNRWSLPLTPQSDTPLPNTGRANTEQSRVLLLEPSSACPTSSCSCGIYPIHEPPSSSQPSVPTVPPHPSAAWSRIATNTSRLRMPPILLPELTSSRPSISAFLHLRPTYAIISQSPPLNSFVKHALQPSWALP